MKNILITTGIFPPDIGGPATYAETIAGALSREGFTVSVLTYSKQFKRPNSDLKFKFKIIRVWGKWPIWIKHLIFGIKLFKAAWRSDAIFSLNVWSSGLPSLIVAKFIHKKFILRIVGDYAWEVAAGKGKAKLLIDDFQKSSKKGWIGILFKFQTWICRKADMVIVPSKYLANIVGGWGVKNSQIKIIYNGVDFKSADVSKEEARKKIGIHGNIILSIGRFVPWKGFRMLVKIMPQFLNLSQFARLVIVGDGPDKEALNLMIRNLGLDKKVYLVGKKTKEELAVYLAAADMFVLNSGYEGFSHQILEAMVCGVPVIASATGGNKEIISQGENGFLVRYNDEFNLVEAVKTVWQNPEIKDEIIKVGKETVKKFSSEKMIEETIKLLNQ